jgi:hypothetical protein
LDVFGITFTLLLDCFWMFWGCFWDNVGMDLGSLWDVFAMFLEQFWDGFGIYKQNQQIYKQIPKLPIYRPWRPLCLWNFVKMIVPTFCIRLEGSQSPKPSDKSAGPLWATRLWGSVF